MFSHRISSSRYNSNLRGEQPPLTERVDRHQRILNWQKAIGRQPFTVMAKVLFAMMPSVTFAVLMSPSMPMAIVFVMAGGISPLVPCVPDEIDRSAASVVLVAVLTPMLFISGRHPQIKRLDMHAGRALVDNERLGIYDIRLGSIANVDPTVETRFAYAD
jgi:hypothetical protein